MPEPRDEKPIDGLDWLRASPRSELDRRRARRRILAAASPLLAKRRPASSWDILAGWARPGLVAASIALAIAVGAVQLTGSRESRPTPVALDDVLMGEGGGAAVLAVLVGNQEPDVEAVLAAELGEPRAEPASPDFPRERKQR
ncbi:MAG: hypothetical protein PVI01_03425 [Gemmatimonadales bacterium]|jgi:anti-sigma-K factor RskA